MNDKPTWFLGREGAVRRGALKVLPDGLSWDGLERGLGGGLLFFSAGDIRRYSVLGN